MQAHEDIDNILKTNSVLERNLVDETETALATSLDEYLDTFGAEEDEFLRACDESANTLKKEQKDERLLELRSRVEVDPMEQLANWQKAAEDSYHQFQLEQRTGEALLDIANHVRICSSQCA